MKTKLIFTFLLCVHFVKAQITPCNGNTPAGNTCATATPICELNGYCGNTSGSYTANSWNSSCGFLGLGNCGLTGEFCGSIENNSFLTFTASATSLSFDVLVTSTTNGYGIQIFIFSANNCSGNVTQYGPCYNPANVPAGPINITANGLTIGNTYYIMIDGNAGDVANYEITANSGVAIPVNVTPETTTICSGQTVNLSAAGGNGTYTWNASPHLSATTGANVVATPPGPGTYTYTVNSSGGNPLCPSATTSTATVTVNPCGCTTAAANSGPICSGGTVNLTSSTIANATYSWTGPAGFTSLDQNPMNVSPPIAPGTYDYTVTATVAGVSCTSTTTVTVTAAATANANIDQQICAGGTITLAGIVGGGATTGIWSAPSGTFSDVNLLNSTYTPSITTGSVSLTLTTNATGTCPSVSDIMLVTIVPNSTADANLDQNVCAGGTINLAGAVGGGATTGTWSAPSGTFSNANDLNSTYTPTITSGNITLTLTSNAVGSCPVAVDQMVVTVDSPPIVNANIDQSICASGVAQLSGSTSGGVTSVTWSASSGTFSNPNDLNSTYSPGVNSGTITLTLTATSNSSCPDASDQMIVSIIPSATADANLDQTICAGNTISLNGSVGGGATSGTWSATSGVFGNTTSLTTTYTPTITSGTITLTLTSNAVGACPAAVDNMILTVIPLPNVNAGNDIVVCEGGTVLLSGSGATSYSWDNGVINGVPFVPLTSGVYTVEGTTSLCTSTDQVNVTVVPIPSISFSSDISSGCVPITVTFSSNSATSGNCLWQISDGSNVAGCGSISHTFTQAGCYDVTLTEVSSDGCSNSLTQNAIVCLSNPPNASFTANPMVINEYDSDVQFTNTTVGATSYVWDFGDESNTSSVQHPLHTYIDPSPGSFTVTLIANTTTPGCSDTASRIIRVEDVLIYYVPNTFTPDGDNYNQTFQPVFTAGFDPYDYSFTVYNRWGEMIFESHDARYGWNGFYGTSERTEISQEGVYSWKIEFKTTASDERKIAHGHVNLMR